MMRGRGDFSGGRSYNRGGDFGGIRNGCGYRGGSRGGPASKSGGDGYQIGNNGDRVNRGVDSHSVVGGLVFGFTSQICLCVKCRCPSLPISQSDELMSDEAYILSAGANVQLPTNPPPFSFSAFEARHGNFVKGESSKVQKSKASTNPNTSMSKVKPHCKFCCKKGHWQRDCPKFKDWLTKKGDRSTSDVVARLRTPDGRDEWIYCHSDILASKSKYFADRLSESWPTCQILDSRNCVEVYCQEHNFDYHITVLRLFYVSIGCSVTDMCHGVKNTLGILQVAVNLGCPEIIATCVDYLEASPWEEAEEEEILKIIPGLGLKAEPILARLQPVNQTKIVKIFLSAILFATSALPPTMVDLKTSAQEQIEYMLTEDDDAPLLTADEDIKSKVRLHFKVLLTRFNNMVKSACETGEMHKFQCFLVDMSWACQILAKLELLKDFVENWIDASENILKAIDQISQSQQEKTLETKVKSAFVSIILALPSGEQAEILSEWLKNKHIRYPDLTEVFEVWCFRSKVANRRLAKITSSNGMIKML
ncbi:hypothetical protein E3N88_36361 [Mikania micrantha]|uniref:CCHC-type domain-containing protein n=1 Tax=Mikania micrantha TaxID=192012 RepID=A0A5N6M421_9ASTR|nr:hypothetical protein E3N88_36361 [Mikania micrantha]